MEGRSYRLNDYEIYAVDFDGTLCKNMFPEIGEPKQKIIDFCIRKREEGHKLILWTCRAGKQLEEAVQWCNEHGLFFHTVNENLADQIVKYNNDPRKIGATYFIDDRNISLNEIENM
jgi:hypothetical protein